jgi:hypothetical protein
MRRGDFAAAWEFSDAFLSSHRDQECWQLPRHEQWIWRGEPLDEKRVLIRCYRGYGDIIQFIRYAPLVRERAREVIVWAPAPLLPLIERVQGVDRVLPLHDGAIDAEYDVDVEVMELAHVFRTALETIPNAVPYVTAADSEQLTADREAVSPVSCQLSSVSSARIGIVHEGGDWDDRRNVPLELMSRISGELVMLDKNSPGAGTPLELAQLMLTLDLVISVDTFAAHLAGALAVPVWTLLHSEPDWRWMLDRDDSPWYPTMRLFRQERAGEWEPVMNKVLAALATRDGARASRPRF